MEQQNNNQADNKKHIIRMVAPVVACIALVAGVLFWKVATASVSIDASHISAPLIALAPENPGILDGVFVVPGNIVTAGTVVAQIGGQSVVAKVSGVIASVQNTPGAFFSSSVPVVTMIDPTALRVVGTIDENKGLADIKIGQPVRFTIDAFGSKEFVGVVDEISPTANTTGVLFKISDKRDVQQFDIKARFDIAANPEFKNGMSAKMRVYVK